MINKYTERFLSNTKIRKGDEDWHLKNMSFELTNEQEAIKQLNSLIESIATGNNTYEIKSFICDVKEAVREVNNDE
tara:strand:- start:98 stop:325 length:228 start_codon:yes stop_codon:yes gene_type:complete